MTLKQLREKRATLLRDAEGLRNQDGSFENDEKRSAFDAKMSEIEELDTAIRVLGGGPTAEPPAPSPAPAPAPAADDTAARATAAERQRISEIHAIATRAGLDSTFSSTHVANGAAIDAVRAAAFDALVARGNAQGGPAGPSALIRMGEDSHDKWLRGATNWLLVKGGHADLVARAANPTAPNVAALDPGEFRGMSLLDLARETIERRNISTRGMDKMTLVGQAFAVRDGAITQTTSDFPTLLENVMHKVMQAAYATQPDTWRRFAAASTVSDFRAHNRYRMGMFGALDSLNEAGEFKNKAISDAEKATITAATKGNIVNVSRQMIVNDDLGAFTRLLAMLGRAAALSVEVDVFAMLLLNSGLGPTQADSQPLFHANRSNVGSQTALGAAALDADRVVMAQQKDPWGNEFLDLRPSVLLVPVGLGGQARIINQSQYDPDTLANKAQMKPNIVNGLFSDIVDSPRISGTRRYLFANPAIAPVFEVAFLEGQTSPVLESQLGWRVDGTEMKVRFDYGVAAVDFRGAVTNAG